MKLLLKAAVFLFVFTFFSCQNEADITSINFEKQFSKNKRSRFPLSDILKINVKWDKVVILPPYFPESILSPLDMKNNSQLKSKIMYNSMDEGLTTVVFLDYSRAVAFSKVRRNLIDLTMLVPASGIRLLTKNESINITVIREKEKKWAKYIIEE